MQHAGRLLTSKCHPVTRYTHHRRLQNRHGTENELTLRIPHPSIPSYPPQPSRPITPLYPHHPRVARQQDAENHFCLALSTTQKTCNHTRMGGSFFNREVRRVSNASYASCPKKGHSYRSLSRAGGSFRKTFRGREASSLRIQEDCTTTRCSPSSAMSSCSRVKQLFVYSNSTKIMWNRKRSSGQIPDTDTVILI